MREEYIFDYRLKPESPAIAAGDPALLPSSATTDRYGLSRGATPRPRGIRLHSSRRMNSHSRTKAPGPAL